MDAPVISALDQLGALLEQHAHHLGVYYQTLITAGIPTDTASEIVSCLAKDLRRMVFK